MEVPFDISYVFEYAVKLLPYIRISLLIVAGSLIVGLGVGFLAALPRLYRIPVLQSLSKLYASFFRGTPILIQLFLFYYGLPEVLKLQGIDLSRVPVLVFVIATYGLNVGAYISEGIRSAVTSVDRGQIEAAYAVGMNGLQAFRRIVLPQALAIAIPIFANVTIGTLKDTSLAFTLGVMELTSKARSLGLLAQHFMEAYIGLAIIYLMISLLLERAFQFIERRMLRHEQPISSSKQARSFKLWQKRRPAPDASLNKGGQ
ncbi:amino acid ABC transporter permease [Cohnella terricola]|uniref:Amino acid ABC transporter permease n=1 Tax=Cohnella terricola TaxID=1289167 RepID=A0A559JWI6_9BACL|nr:amino acid ABC transporter permease [Cohnella terricola]TVY04251.1 amino acid ABC transporter permease [Cohnella terricola]